MGGSLAGLVLSGPPKRPTGLLAAAVPPLLNAIGAISVTAAVGYSGTVVQWRGNAVGGVAGRRWYGGAMVRITDGTDAIATTARDTQVRTRSQASGGGGQGGRVDVAASMDARVSEFD
jgi:hypothetical protein